MLGLVIFFIALNISSARAWSRPETTKPESNIRRIVVVPENVTNDDLPYDTKLWQAHSNKIKTLVKDPVKFSESPRSAYALIQITQDKYNETVETLRNNGYYVRDELKLRLLLNESLPLIGVPYQLNSPGTPPYTSLNGSGTTITIIDTGVDMAHPDLHFPGENPDCGNGTFWNPSCKLLAWFDSTGDYNIPVDYNGHGTHVASIATGTGILDGRYKGVAPGAHLKAVKTFSNSTVGNFESFLRDAIQWAINNGTDVISMSLSLDATSEDMRRLMCLGTWNGPVNDIYSDITRAIWQNITVVAAAGNFLPEYKTLDFPACIDGVIAVGASFKNEKPAFFTPQWLFDPQWNYTPPSNAADKAEMNLSYIIELSSEGKVVSQGTIEGYQPWSGSMAGKPVWGEGWSGFHQIIHPDIWPAKIKVKLEGQHRKRICFSSEYRWWDPGNESQGDAYWAYESVFDSGPYIHVEVMVKPTLTNFGTCYLPGQPGWWDRYYLPSEDRVVRVYASKNSSVDNVVTFSGRGPPSHNVSAEKPTLIAPGVSICAARGHDNRNITEDAPYLICGNDEYIANSGTSMATPHVSGLVALLKQANPAASYEEITNALLKTDKKIIASDCLFTIAGGCDITLQNGVENKVKIDGGAIGNKGLCVQGSDYKAQFTVDSYDIHCGQYYCNLWGVNIHINDKNVVYLDCRSKAPQTFYLEGGHEITVACVYNDLVLPIIPWVVNFTFKYANSGKICDASFIKQYNKNVEGEGRINAVKSIDFITNCSLKPSLNTGDTGKKPLVAGSCYNYTAWSGASDSCTGTVYNDYCSADGNSVYEYFASGASCEGYWKNCKDFGSNYVCIDGKCTSGCRSEGGRCMAGSGGCMNYCKRKGMWGYCEISYPGCYPSDCCCICA